MNIVKRMKKTISVSTAVFAVLLFLNACANTNKDYWQVPQEMPDDFDFSFSFGWGGLNVVDTYKGKLTKDLVMAGRETIDFTVSEEKMCEIYAVFLEYEIYDLPKDINKALVNDDEVMVWVSPECTYILTYTVRGKKKTITCDTVEALRSTKGMPDEVAHFIEFGDMLRDWVWNIQEYKDMPKPTGGYV